MGKEFDPVPVLVFLYPCFLLPSRLLFIFANLQKCVC